MTNIQVPITDDEREKITARLASRGVTDISQYIRRLVEDDLDVSNGEIRDWVDDLDDAGRAKLEAMLQEGVDSLDRGEGAEATPQFWKNMRARVQSHIRDGQG